MFSWKILSLQMQGAGSLEPACNPSGPLLTQRVGVPLLDFAGGCHGTERPESSDSWTSGFAPPSCLPMIRDLANDSDSSAFP